jgi:hypothetical protein
LTEAWPRQDKQSRTEGEEPSHTREGVGFPAGRFGAAAGTETACDGSTNVQSTLEMYKNMRREKGYTGALFGGSKLWARGMSATRDLDAIPLTMVSWLENGLDEGAVFPFCWYLALYASMAG